MATTKIEWATKVWNPITGCTMGCSYCYARRFAHRLMHNPKAGKKYQNGFEPTFHESELTTPLTWNKGERVFVGSMGDLFDRAFTNEQIDIVFTVMSDMSHLTFFVLTKNTERLLEFIQWKTMIMGARWLPSLNVWLGTSIEKQVAAADRVPDLMMTNHYNLFVSVEPLHGSIGLHRIMPTTRRIVNALTGVITYYNRYTKYSKIGWVIIGGETGPHSKAMDPDWAHDLIAMCRHYNVPVFFKSWGAAHKHLAIPANCREFPKL